MRRGVIMGGLIAFPGRGSEVPGHLAIPPEAHRRGALVVSEHRGSVPRVSDVCSQLARDGLVGHAGSPARSSDDRSGSGRRTKGGRGSLPGGAGPAGPGRQRRDQFAATKRWRGRLLSRRGCALVAVAERSDGVRAVVPFCGAIPSPGAGREHAAPTGAVLGRGAVNDGWATSGCSRDFSCRSSAWGEGRHGGARPSGFRVRLVRGHASHSPRRRGRAAHPGRRGGNPARPVCFLRWMVEQVPAVRRSMP